MEHTSDKISVHSAIRKLENGILNLNPLYQRNAVWTISQKQLLIDSIIVGIPIPSFYFNRVPDDKIDVVDGQQRLRSISDFKSDLFALSEDGSHGSKKYSELPERVKDLIDDYQLNIIFLQNWSEEQIEDMFLRLQDGTPLNAPEKRRAIQGTFRDVVKELSDHKFFYNRVGFNNDRYGYEDAVAKALHLMLKGFVPISPAKIKATYKENSRITNSDNNVSQLKRSYTFLEKGFKNHDDINPALKKWASITLPLVINELRESFKIDGLELEVVKAFIELEITRAEEREKPEDQQNAQILNFNDSARADDPVRLKYRHDFLKTWILSKVDSIEPKDLDTRRLFTHEQRMALFFRSQGKCQMCSDKITQDNFEADHITRHTDGGQTILSNGRALCITCNRSRGTSNL